MSLGRDAAPLREIGLRLGAQALKQVVAQPGVNEALRLTIQYAEEGNPPDSVATLVRGAGATCSLTLLYDKRDSGGDFYHYSFSIPLARYQALLAALRVSKFDTLDDVENLPLMGVDKWLVERCSGSFHHDVVLAPERAIGHHRELVVALRKDLSEAVRRLVV